MDQFSSNKIFNHLDRVMEWQAEGISRPVTYELDMTNVCDSKCPFCFGFLKREKNPFSITFNEVAGILRQIRDFGGRGVTFTGGGEPLCNPDTVKAVRYARDIGLDVGFITNGISMNNEICGVLVECCTWIRISLDAGSKEYYRISHGLDSDTFERVVYNTGYLVNEKIRRGSSVTIGTGFITFPEVMDDAENFIKVSSSAGVDYAQFRPLLKSFNEKEINLQTDTRMVERVYKDINSGNNGFRVLFSENKYNKLKNNSSGRRYAKCLGHHFTAVVAADKKMYLCCHMRGQRGYCIGDLSRDSIEEI